METEKEINAEILRLTMMVHDKYPELEGSLDELSGTFPDTEHPEINSKTLKEYLDTLKTIINNYRLEHNEELTNQ